MTIYLDIKTTGLRHSDSDSMVEIAIVNDDKEVLIDTLIDPEISIPWYSTKIHGITDAMVNGRPTLNEIMPTIIDIISNQETVLYNADLYLNFFPSNLSEAKKIECAMHFFNSITEIQGSRNLNFAASCADHIWEGDVRRALAGALACRSVWLWLHTDTA
jgi:DNA polymerase III alpha subunit (gram-positive type)